LQFHEGSPVHCSFLGARAPIGVIALNQACYKRWVAMRLDGGIRMDLSSGLMNLVVSRRATVLVGAALGVLAITQSPEPKRTPKANRDPAKAA